MKKLLFMIYCYFPLISFLASCSVFKRQTEDRQSRQEVRLYESGENDSLQQLVQEGSAHFLLEDNLQYTEIIPAGLFSYRADSGFSGQAQQIRIIRKNSRQEWLQDTASSWLNSGSSKESSDQQVRQQQETAKSSEKFSLSYGWLLIPALLLAVLVIFFLKKTLKRD